MTDAGKQTNAGDTIGKGAVLGLAAMAVGVFIIANDFTALSVALPAIEKDFSVDVTTAQWVINGYALVFGVLIVTGGRLADMFGRRRSFFLGAAIFAAFSTLGGLAPDIWLLLASRLLMGIGGALMWPAILGMTYALLPDNRAGLAGGIIIGAAGFGNAAGPLIGGALTDSVGWRWVFFLNLPIAVFGVLVTWLVISNDTPDKGERGVDYSGIAVLSAGLLALLLALDQGTDLGWFDPWIVGLFVFGASALIVFALIERRVGARALLPEDVARNKAFFTACIATLLMSSLFFAAVIYLPQFLMKRLDYSAVEAGAALLPVMGMFAATSFFAGPLYDKFGAKTVTSIGAMALAAGMFMLTVIAPDTAYRALVPGMLVLGFGIGLFYSSITTAGITAVDKSRSSLAGAIVYMFQIAGGSIGLGLNTAIVVTAPSLATGISRAFFVDACLAVAGFLIVLLFVGGKVDRQQIDRLIHRHRAHG
jgi:EmrB/QacA subfamily drug resistance transporter